jgi:hypothetical protein
VEAVTKLADRSAININDSIDKRLICFEEHAFLSWCEKCSCKQFSTASKFFAMCGDADDIPASNRSSSQKWQTDTQFLKCCQ